MAVSNQLRTTAKKVKKVSTPSRFGDAVFQSPASGLDRIGVSAAEALKSKKVKNLSLKGVSNY